MFKSTLIILFISLFLQSCSSTINTNYSLNKLKYGLTKEEVINNVFKSKPTEKKIIDSNKEIYVYHIHTSIMDLILTKKFPYIGLYPLSRTGREYWLLFDKKDGLVKSAYGDEWGKVK